MKRNWKAWGILVFFIAAVAAAVLAGRFRLDRAYREADAYAAETGISTTYEKVTPCETREDILTEMWKLAAWESGTRKALNEAYGRTDQEYKEEAGLTANGFEPSTELHARVWEGEWRRLRAALDTEVRAVIGSVYGENGQGESVEEERAEGESEEGESEEREREEKASRKGETGDAFELTEEKALWCYEKGWFDKIGPIMAYAEKGDGAAAYEELTEKCDIEARASLVLYIPCGLYPEVMRAGCEEVLQKAIDEAAESGRDVYLMLAVWDAEGFAERSGLTVSNLTRAQRLQKSLEYKSKAEVPRYGMRVNAAKNTKLGAPTRTDERTNRIRGIRQVKGTMYWERGGTVIFKAEYEDDKITGVTDLRNQKKSRPRYYSYGSSRSSGSSGSSRSTVDPDDHDIDSYYEDHRDEYDNYEEAWDAFLDDSGAWDDY